jgi:hypothetical protein
MNRNEYIVIVYRMPYNTIEKAKAQIGLKMQSMERR